MNIRNYTYAACVAASLSMFTACGDDVTEVTNVSEKASLDQVDKFKQLPKCETEIEGSLVYVKDSAKVFACTGDGWIQLNGKDGEAGKNGENGKDGENGKNGSGAACTVTKAKSGDFDVKCDGKTVGTIKNGADGKDGESCTAKENKDKNGYDIVCAGKTVGTVTNGSDGSDGSNGDDGDGCTLTEGENGDVTVKCGANSATLFKAVCGGITSYDPETQLCGSYYDNKTQKSVYLPIKRCKDWSKVGSWYDEDGDYSDWTYNPNEYFCDENSVLQPMCRWTDDNGDDVVKKYDPAKEYCDNENKKIAKKVPCAEGSKEMRKPTEYCFTTNKKSKMQTAELLVCGSGNSAKEYSPVTHFCKKSTGVLGKKSICAKNPNKADQFNIDIRYMAEASVDDNTSQLCDTRDYQIYNTVTVDGVTWMTQNLNYNNKQKTEGLDSSSFCLNNDPKECETRGRLYLWSAAIDSTTFESNDIFCGNGEAPCKFDEPVKGVCPEGWHLPSATELEKYPYAQVSEKMTSKIYGEITAELNTYLSNFVTLWSSTEYVNEDQDGDSEEGNAVYFKYSASASTEMNASKASRLNVVRCVKDSEEEPDEN